MKNNLEEVFTPKTTEEIIKDQLELKEKAYQNYLLVHNYNDSISIREDFMAGFDEGAGLRGFFGRYSASLNDRNKQLELEQELQKAQEEINSLRSAYKKNIDSLSAGLSEDLLKILKTYPTALPYICELKQELQKTREYLGKAIKSAEFFMSHADCKKDSWVCKCSFCIDTESSKNLREARQYFKNKENKE